MEIREIVYEYQVSSGDRMAWHSRYHAHGEREFELHYFLEGSGSFLNHRSRHPIQPDCLFLTGPQEFHSIIPEQGRDTPSSKGRPISYYAILFTCCQEEEEYSLLNKVLAFTHQPIKLNPKYHFLFELIYQWGGMRSKHKKKAAIHQLISLLYAVYGKEEEVYSVPQAGIHHVQKAISYMRREVKHKITVEQLARVVGISKEYLIRLFRKHLKISPLQYAMRLRIEAASGYLISTNKTIGEIAQLLEYENQYHFTRVFKKCTGLTPSNYRKNYMQYVDFFPPNLTTHNSNLK